MWKVWLNVVVVEKDNQLSAEEHIKTYFLLSHDCACSHTQELFPFYKHSSMKAFL